MSINETMEEYKGRWTISSWTIHKKTCKYYDIKINSPVEEIAALGIT